jgi:hypothetical protein
MPGPASCLLAAFLASSAVVEAAAGVDGEVAAGRAPVQLTGPEENSLTFTLTPGAGLRLRSATNRLSLAYTPRIFYRVPNALTVSRPLVLHQVSLDNAIALSRRMSWTSSAQVSVGEIDYTAAGVVYDQLSSGLRTSVADIVRSEGQTGFQLELTRRLRWTATLSADHTTPLGDTSSTPVLPPDVNIEDLGNLNLGSVPESAQVSAESSFSYALTRADRVALNGEVTYQWFPDTGRFLLLSPDVSWTSALNKRTNIALSAGFAYVITLATPDDSEPGDAIGGTGSFALDTVIYRARSVRVSTGYGASLDWFFDPIAGTSQPRAAADAGASIDIGRDWNISPNISFYTVLRGASATLGEPPIMSNDGMMTPIPVPAPAPAAADDVQRNFDSTQLRAEIPFRYRLSDPIILNFGLRGSLRGGALSEDDFRLNERTEFWVFAGITVRLGSGHDDGSWLAL